MQNFNGSILFAASDLMAFSGCIHRTALDRMHLEAPMTKTTSDDHVKLIQRKGHEHEAAYLQALRDAGSTVVEIPDDIGLDEQVRLTREALFSGADVVYQAVLLDGAWHGKADFLLRVDTPSGLGGYHYEVADTKLARKPKPSFLLQLCLYSDLLEKEQGELPRQCHVILGDGTKSSFDVINFYDYYRLLRERFEAFVADEGRKTISDPCAACELCHWRERCEDEWTAADHLNQVANLGRGQRRRLVENGISTMADLAGAAKADRPRRMGIETFDKLRSQASLQVAERETGEHSVVTLPLDPDGVRGFCRLPMPDEGDMFFDMEGYPHIENGLEYLFGVHFLEDGSPKYRAFWGHDRKSEGEAFNSLVDFMDAQLKEHPHAHIYHYANYEERALKNLMSLHGSREEQVDNWLRKGKLVDLYKVVREGIQVSQPSYSIKYLEVFYMEKRQGDVQSAAGSVVEYDRWMEIGDPEILESIRAYNEDDCVSTRLLRDWLLENRPSELPWYHAAEETTEPDENEEDDPDPAVVARLELVEAIGACGASENVKKLTLELLDFHQRAAKPGYWALFSRAEAFNEDLIDDNECIGGLNAEKKLASNVCRYRFPPQESKILHGSTAFAAHDKRQVGEVVGLDLDRGEVDLKLTKRRCDEGLPSVFSLTPGGPVNDRALRGAVQRYAEALSEGRDEFRAVTAILSREIPRIEGVRSGTPVIPQEEDVVAGTVSAVANLDQSYLYVQGPPGAGKTHVGSRVIVELLKRGFRIGVAANSHKAINNILREVESHSEEVGFHFNGCKKVNAKKEDTYLRGRIIQDVPGYDDIDDSVKLVGGTAWLFSREEYEQTFDYLFVDEAGQISLGNLVAMGTAASNIVLLGDQMQLGQPTQGVHPGDSGLSVLDYLLQDHPTIPPERGIFLPETWRMHEDVCRWVSDHVYEGRLDPHPDNAYQVLTLGDGCHAALKPTGISFIEVSHQDRSQRCPEEASVIKDIYENLLEQGFVDRRGSKQKFLIDNILVVAPYNMQVNLLQDTLPEGARVGTVDKFQGQQAEVVILSMTSSSGEDMPRGIDFLFNKNRLNVAISRARSLAIVTASPDLLSVPCATVKGMEQASLLCSLVTTSRK